jgi:hypothetical protein
MFFGPYIDTMRILPTIKQEISADYRLIIFVVEKKTYTTGRGFFLITTLGSGFGVRFTDEVR